MTHTSATARNVARVCLAGASALATALSLSAFSPASAATTHSPAPASANPYSPAYQHAYRHGVLPTIGQEAKMRAYDAAHPAAATGPETLSYGGGVDGIGVNSGKNKTYLVFYGNQWGTEGTDSNGNATFSGDPDGAAPVAQMMFKGIGTGNELWSADLTQWCDGPNVAAGATSCPSNAAFVPYQNGGVLAGVWYDNSQASPSAASGNQLGQEAVAAAAHFGNTTAASNRYTYYVILSPTGTNPDNYQGQYCAWHDYTGDSSLTGGAVNSPYGDIAFSNQPYNMDSGSGCGVGFINSPGTLDGWTMTLGHEWHEMMSDKNPAGGWTNQTGSSYNGQENSDECAWLSPGTAGGAANVTMGNGTYAEQASWSNDTNACSISHPILTHGNTVTVGSQSAQSWTVGKSVSLQMSATDSASGQSFTWSASGLPAGVSINSSSGLISGTPTTASSGNATVTATDTTGASGSTTVSWKVSSSTGGNTVTVTNPGNQSGTVGTAVSLQIKASDSASGQTLTYSASGLPAGLSISSSGLISGTPTTAATSNVTVTAKDTTGATGTASFTWTITTSGGGGCTAAQLLGNPGFETGSASPWTSTSGVIQPSGSEPAHSGNYLAWLDGYGTPHTDTLAQTVTIPSTCASATFSYWWYIDTSESTSTNADDTLTVQVLNSSGTVLATLHTYSNLNADNTYTQASFSLSKYIGQKITVKFTGVETDNDYGTTDFLIDDTALNVK